MSTSVPILRAGLNRDMAGCNPGETTTTHESEASTYAKDSKAHSWGGGGGKATQCMIVTKSRHTQYVLQLKNPRKVARVGFLGIHDEGDYFMMILFDLSHHFQGAISGLY